MDWHKHFRYDAESGILIRKWVGNKMQSLVGKPAGSIHWTGYVRVSVKERDYRVHRVVWEMHNGPIPKGMMIDHIDGNPTNNRLANLRLASDAQNQFNRGIKATNTSGFRGVTWNKKACCWHARIRKNGKNVHLGQFDNPLDASAAYEAAAKELHGEFFRAA